VEFGERGPRTRDGHSTYLSVSDKVTSIYSWLTSVDYIGKLNRLVYYEGSTLKMKDLIVGGAPTSLFTLAGEAAIIREVGQRIYATVVDSDGLGEGQCRVVNALLSGSPSDKAFIAPMNVTLAVTDVGAGVCTAGTHRFGFILESRSGFLGPFCPDAGAGFVYKEATVADGGRSLTLSFTADIPADAAYCHAVMTRADNFSIWSFVTGGSIAVPGGTPAWLVAMSIDISDAELSTIAVEANDNLYLLTQTAAGAGPFNPRNLFLAGNRQAYILDAKAYFSDEFNYQTIAEDRSAVYLPGRKQIIAGFAIRSVYYLLGPDWTYGYTENKDYPSSWQPEEVSSSLGTSAPRGVCTETAGDYVWVVHKSGLYMFDGRYQDMPISWMNDAEWKRINWGAPSAVHVVDDVEKQRVIVTAALDSETEPSHRLVFGYRAGKSPYTVDFSLDDFASGNFGCTARVHDPTTNRTYIMTGPGAAGSILKEDSSAVGSDDGDAINSVYETGLALTKSDGPTKENMFGSADLDISGAGQAQVTPYNKGKSESDGPQIVTLSDDPDSSPELDFDIRGENATLKVETNSAGHWFDLAGVTMYWRRWTTNK